MTSHNRATLGLLALFMIVVLGVGLSVIVGNLGDSLNNLTEEVKVNRAQACANRELDGLPLPESCYSSEIRALYHPE